MGSLGGSHEREHHNDKKTDARMKIHINRINAQLEITDSLRIGINNEHSGTKNGFNDLTTSYSGHHYWRLGWFYVSRWWKTPEMRKAWGSMLDD